jgi:hypothetical protein
MLRDVSYYEIEVPSIVYQTLQLDVAECRKVYSLSDLGGGNFVTTKDNWRRVLDDFEDFGHELPERVIEDFRSIIDKALSAYS